MFIIETFIDSGTGKMELILEKILTPSPIGSVRRQRLHDLLNQGMLSGTSTILSGRAGTGKTVLAFDFAEDCGRVVAWYKVDAPDSEMRIFFQYLIASIRTQRPRFGGSALLSLLHQVNLETIPIFAEAFVYELERAPDAPLLVVIDDLHQVCDAKWLVPFFGRLLPLLPSDVHMLITSRTVPPAPLWRMRSKQTLFVIDEECLAFTRSEAIELFQKEGLTPEQATIALEHSHGRAAALANMAAALRFAEASETKRLVVFDMTQSLEAM
jgi:ATP/maltotriose-dependent transcriptional regulator MalT